VISGLPLGPHPCNAFALTPGLPLSWPVTLQPLCLGRKPKARVATDYMDKEIGEREVGVGKGMYGIVGS